MDDKELQKIASQPKKVEIDGQTVEQHDLKSIAEFDRYMEAKKASAKRSSGIKFSKFMASGG